MSSGSSRSCHGWAMGEALQTGVLKSRGGPPAVSFVSRRSHWPACGARNLIGDAPGSHEREATMRRAVFAVPLFLAACAVEEPVGPINRALRVAAEERGVPLPLLKAIGYVETRFQPEGTSIDQGFGPMNL